VRALDVWVAGTMPVFERAAPLVWAVLGDINARERYEHNESLRRAGYGRMLDVLVTKHPLRPGLDPRRALDVLLVVLGPQLFRQLTHDLDWSTGTCGCGPSTCFWTNSSRSKGDRRGPLRLLPAALAPVGTPAPGHADGDTEAPQRAAGRGDGGPSAGAAEHFGDDGSDAATTESCTFVSRV
jgi:hypothetical protein